MAGERAPKFSTLHISYNKFSLTKKLWLPSKSFSSYTLIKLSDNSLIATEKLNLKGMTRKSKGKRKRQKTGLNRSILDVGIGNSRKENFRRKGAGTVLYRRRVA